MNSNDIQKQLAKLRRNKKLLWVGIMLFVMVVLWILASIFATSKTSSVSPELRNLAKSFVPRLESAAFEEIIDKKAYSAGELSYFPIYIFDKKSTDGGSVLIDIIAPIEELAATEAGQLEEIIPSISPQVSPTPTPQASQSTQAEQPAQADQTPQVIVPASQDSGYMPIPIESIIGPQN